KTVLVTGGTSGIGLVTARELARKGAHVTITARSTAKGESAKNVICSDLQSSQCSRVETLTLDLASLNNIAKFSDHFHQKHNSLDVLILNAGVMGCPFQLSEDGYELQFATNHLGHFFLTYLLLPLLDRANEGRVVTVTSGAHQAARGGIRFDSLDSDRDYSYFGAYAQSKLANILFSNELSRQLQSRNSTITANSLHPGFIRTNLARHIMAATRENSPWYWVMDVLEMYVMSGAMSVHDGALTQ
ncbi:TIC32, partial [Symbiodinium microadriaticum]